MSDSQEKTDPLLACKHEWPLIARDIALMTVPSGQSNFTASDIARTYGLSEADFARLTATPAFETLVKGELDRVRSMGPNAGARMRAEAMAVAMQEQIFNQARSGMLDDKAQLQFLGMLLKTAGLEQPPEAARAAAAQSVVNIAFNIPKLRNAKLAHLMTQAQTNVVTEAQS